MGDSGNIVGLQAGSNRRPVLAPSRGRQTVEDMPLVIFHRLAKAAPRGVEVGTDKGSSRADLRSGPLLVTTSGKVIEPASGFAREPRADDGAQ